MQKVQGVNLIELFEREDIKSLEDISLLKTGLQLQMWQITNSLDEESKSILNKIVEMVATEIKDEKAKGFFLIAMRKYLYGLSYFHPGVFEDKDFFSDFLNKILDATKASKDYIVINDTYIYDGDYVFLKNQKAESLLKVSELDEDSVILTDTTSDEKIYLYYNELIDVINLEKTSLYSVASAKMIRGNLFIWMHEAYIEDIINDYAKKISDKHVREKFTKECIDNTIKFRCWVSNFEPVEVISIIQGLWFKYNLNKPSITVSDRTYYIGSYVVMTDMDCKYDTVISNIENGTVYISNKFNINKNMASYTIEEFKEKVFSSYEMFLEPNYVFKKEDFPMLLVGHIIYPKRVATTSKKKKNTVTDYSIYVDAAKDFLRYRVEDIPDRKNAEYHIKDMIGILDKSSYTSRGIWETLSLIEIFDYEWDMDEISKKSIYVLNDFRYAGNIIGVKGYTHHDEIEIKSITDNEIVIGRRFHPELYTKTFKSASDLEEHMLNMEDVYDIEKALEEDKSLLNSDYVVSQWLSILRHTKFNYRYNHNEREYIEKTSSKVRSEHFSYHTTFINTLSEDELLVEIVDYLIQKYPELSNIGSYTKKDVANTLLKKVITLYYKGVFGASILTVSFSQKQVLIATKSKDINITMKLDKFINKMFEIISSKKEFLLDEFEENDYDHYDEEQDFDYDYVDEDTDSCDDESDSDYEEDEDDIFCTDDIDDTDDIELDSQIESISEEDDDTTCDNESDIEEDDICYIDDINSSNLDTLITSIIENEDFNTIAESIKNTVAPISEEDVLSNLVSHIYEINQCETVNLKNMKTTTLFLKGCYIEEEINIQNNKIAVAKNITKKEFICANSDNEFTFKFEVIARELINLKNSLIEQLDLFSMLG